MNREVDAASTRHEYSRARSHRSRVEFVREVCRGKRVLHIGCVDAGFYEKHVAEGRFLQDDIAEVAEDVIGIDVDVEGVERMKADGYSRIVVADITQAQGRRDVSQLLESTEQLDVILCGEVIEHVPNPFELVRGLLELSRITGAEIVITTPNPFYWGRFVGAALRRETVHPDHNSYLSVANLKTLARKAGGATDLACEFYENPASSRLVSAVKRAVSRFLPGLSDGVIVRFRSSEVITGAAAARLVTKPAESE